MVTLAGPGPTWARPWELTHGQKNGPLHTEVEEQQSVLSLTTPADHADPVLDPGGQVALSARSSSRDPNSLQLLLSSPDSQFRIRLTNLRRQTTTSLAARPLVDVSAAFGQSVASCPAQASRRRSAPLLFLSPVSPGCVSVCPQQKRTRACHATQN
jgi:hypothetical protein